MAMAARRVSRWLLEVRQMSARVRRAAERASSAAMSARSSAISARTAAGSMLGCVERPVPMR